MKAMFFLILLLYNPLLSLSQQLRVTSFRVEEGLPTNYTKSVVQDKNGFIWIATDAGLIFYDGKSLTQLKDVLPSNYIKSLLVRKDGSLVIGHDAGVSTFKHGRDTLLINHLMDAENESSPVYVHSPKTLALFEDPDGNLWVSEPGAMVLYKNGQIRRYPFDEQYASAYFLRSFVSCHDGLGSFITASQRGYLFRYDRSSDSFKKLPVKENLGEISTLLLTSSGSIWVGAAEGIYELRLDEDGGLASFRKTISLNNVSFITQVNNGYYIGTWFDGLFKLMENKGVNTISKVEGIEGKVVNYVFCSSNEDIWVSMDQGLRLIQNNYFSRIDYDNERPFVHSVFPSQNGKFYASDARLVVEFVKKEQSFEPKVIFRLPEFEIRSLAVYYDSVWIGTSNAMIYRYHQGILQQINLNPSNKDIFFMNIDSKGNVWATQLGLKGINKITKDMKVVEYGTESGFLSNIHMVREDKKGNILCAGSGKETYLYRYNPKEDKFENISKPLKFDFSGMLHIQDIAFDSENRLWLASNKGLLMESDDGFEQIDLSLNKVNSLIKAIAIDKENGIWFGTDIGLFRYYHQEVAYFNEFNGMPSRNVGYRDICFDKEDHLWVATTTGLARSNHPLRAFEKTPSPILFGLTINDKPVPTSSHKFITNSFVQINYFTPTYPGEHVSYRYRLQPNDQKWEELGIDNKIVLKNLPKGKYKLEVQAMQQGNFLWSGSSFYQFTIVHPWYFRWWSIISYVILSIMVVYWIVRYNTRRLKREKLQLEKIIHDRTIEIVNQKEEILVQKEAIEAKSQALENAFEEIHQQKFELEKLNATKDKFFSIVAHDIRGPLGSLSGFTRLLATNSASLSPQEVEFIAKDLDNAVKNTLELTENLLIWARGQMNKISYNPQPVDVNKIIFTNLDLFSTAAKNKQLRLEAHVAEGVMAIADPEQLDFVVRNFISNAIKFTPKGGSVTVHSILEKDMIEVAVMDTGIGMDPEYVSKIFHIDAKDSRKGTEGEKGTGLGLVLCKDFIEKNGGNMRITSEPEKGSRFAFTLKKTSIAKEVNQ
jgi:signal transduction histidine kinase/ligand-binding sensor domain-containing protein